MNADNLNRWLTLVANLAVVAGIIFLALELRQNTIMQERQMEFDRITSMNAPYYSSPELARALIKTKEVDGLEPSVAEFVDRYDFTPEEAVVYSRYILDGWYKRNAHFTFFGPSENLERRLRGLMKYPDVRIVFELNEDSELTPEFVAYVKSIVADSQYE